MNLRRMEPHPSQAGRIQAYEFGDFVTLDTVTRLKHSNFSLGTLRVGWRFFTTRLPLLIGRGIGEVMLPLVAASSEIPRVPPGKDLLAAPIKSLQWISQRDGQELRAGFLSADWIWHQEHAPFGFCPCMRDWKHPARCERVQFVVRRGRKGPRFSTDLSEHVNGIVLIGTNEKRPEAGQVANQIREDSDGCLFLSVRQTVMSSADARYVSPSMKK